jgi:hypothetical protein
MKTQNSRTLSTVANGDLVRYRASSTTRSWTKMCWYQRLTYSLFSLPLLSGHKGKQTNLISAMIKYGTDKNRFTTMTRDDLELASEALDPELMQLFKYEMPSL